jgi:3-hydroxybutyrate dehydrogenase
MLQCRRSRLTDLGGRCALVTGAARGIGRAIASALEQAGASVLAVDLDPDPDGPALPFAADLSLAAGNREAVDAALERLGGIDILVPNAGLQHVAPIESFPEERWHKMLAVMLTSPFLLAKHAWTVLAESGQGRVIAVASAHGLVASPDKAAYVAAKHGLVGLIKTIALEGAPSGVLAAAVCPGFVRTSLVETQVGALARLHDLSVEEATERYILGPHAVKRLIEPEEVARFVAFLAGPGGAPFSGCALPMDLGWTAR